MLALMEKFQETKCISLLCVRLCICRLVKSSQADPCTLPKTPTMDHGEMEEGALV